mgnify:CR=1 FL=1
MTSLEILCAAYGMWREMEGVIFHYTDDEGKRRKRGMADYLEGRNAQTSPEVATKHKAEQTHRSLMAGFGLSRLSRQRVTPLQKEQEVDPMEALLNSP